MNALLYYMFLLTCSRHSCNHMYKLFTLCMNQADRSYRSLDFGSCQIRVLRVNDAPASFPVPTLETPEQGKSTSQPPHGTRALALQKLRRICQAEVRRLKASHLRHVLPLQVPRRHPPTGMG